jgi:hypothetical protein
MKQQADRLFIGITIGLVVPFLVLFIYYKMKFGQYIAFFDFVNQLIYGNKLFAPIISLCCIANLAVFYLFYYFHYNQNARGIIFATIIYTIVVIFLKFQE